MSSATLNRDENGDLLGNAQMTARWIAEETGADVFPIQTAYTYPSDYNQTVAVGEGQDIDFVDLKLASHLEDVSGYDTVYLVAPVWHYTVCTPLRAFLTETDLSGKTVYVFTAHCGSRFADSVKKIQQMQPGATVIQGVAVFGDQHLRAARRRRKVRLLQSLQAMPGGHRHWPGEQILRSGQSRGRHGAGALPRPE